jgi:hypothetical protein
MMAPQEFKTFFGEPSPRVCHDTQEHLPPLFPPRTRKEADTLYDLGRDPGEKNDVAAQHPEIVARLTQEMAEFDAKLQRDKRPMQFVEGPPPPPPQMIRTDKTDLSVYRSK